MEADFYLGLPQDEFSIKANRWRKNKTEKFGILLKREEVANLQVTVALPSNQIVFGSICMETSSIVLPQNASTVAAISVDSSIDFRPVNDADDARWALLKAGQLLEVNARTELVLQSLANSKYTISPMKNLG